MKFLDKQHRIGNLVSKGFYSMLLAGMCATPAFANDAPPLPPQIQLSDNQTIVAESSVSSPSSLPGTMVLDEDFESGNIGELGSQYYFDHGLNVVRTGSGDAPSSGAQGGSKIVRFELRPEDRNSVKRWRTEVHSSFGGVWQGHKTNWAEWYLYFPRNFNPGELDGALIIGQVHGNDSPDNGPVATITLQYEPNTGDYYWNVSSKSLKNSAPQVDNVTKGGSRGNEFKEHGKWVKLKIQFKSSLSNDGVLRVWKDDKLLGESTGKVGTSEKADPYFKTGLYHKGTRDMVMFADDIRLSVQ